MADKEQPDSEDSLTVADARTGAAPPGDGTETAASRPALPAVRGDRPPPFAPHVPGCRGLRRSARAPSGPSGCTRKNEPEFR